MSDLAVADTGPILHLAEIGQVNNLAVFRGMTISDQVRSELARLDAFQPLEAALADRLTVTGVSQTDLDTQAAALSGFRLHLADLSVAVLAARLLPDVVLTDDLELRKGLEAQGHKVVGSVGVLVRAFKVGRLTKVELQFCLDQLLDGSTLYLSTAFRSHVRKLLGELH